MSPTIPEDQLLVGAINEDAKSLWIQLQTVLFVGVSSAVSARTLKDESFLSPAKLIFTVPIVDVPVPMDGFFLVTSLLLIALHMALLFHQYYLLEKLDALPWKRGKVKRELLYSSIVIRGHFPGEYPRIIRLLQSFSFWLLHIAFPFFVLVYLQMSLLRLNDIAVKIVLGICTVITLVASGCFILAVQQVKRNQDLWGPPAKRAFVLAGVLVAVAFVVWFGCSYVRVLPHPPTCRAKEKERRLLGIIPARRYLTLTSIPEELHSVDDQGRKYYIFSRDLELKCATFKVPDLVRADFRGVDLTGVVFDGVNLQDADFSSFGSSITLLRDARFLISDLARAKFGGSLLIDVDLREANLLEADFSRANLTRAKMNRANLVGAFLREQAQLRSADFRGALLALASFDDSSFELARFDNAWLDRASFSRGEGFGASFRRVRARRAIGIPLDGIDLQGASVWGVDNCSLPAEFPMHVDLRNLNVVRVADWRSALKEVRFDKRGKPLYRFSDPVWERIEVLLTKPVEAQGPTCFSDAASIKKAQAKGWPESLREHNVLHGGPQAGPPMEGWPLQPSLTEEKYLNALVYELVDKRTCEEETRLRKNDPRESTLLSLLKQRAKESGRFAELLRRRLSSPPCSSAVPG